MRAAQREREGGRPAGFEVVIGLEIHAQLRTRSKLFCSCPAAFGAPPNRNLCPVCLGLPGALPVANARAVELAVRAALALGADICARSLWARKHYFYPDLPKGYQITQYEEPLATGGFLSVPQNPGGAQVRLQRLHLEEDAGRSLHSTGVGGGASRLDFNRCGVPLIEIVTLPDLRSATAASACMRQIKQILEHCGVSAGQLEKGTLRCDANLSLRRKGAAGFGVPTEIKNLNSFRHLARALESEAVRQAKILAGGGRVTAATLLWDADAGELRVMRTKERAADYRYFPEPDLPPLCLSEEQIARIGAGVGELPPVRQVRWEREFGLRTGDAERLLAQRALADYFDAVAGLAPSPARAATFILSGLSELRMSEAASHQPFRPSAEDLAGLLQLQAARGMSDLLAKRLLREMIDTGLSAELALASAGLEPVRDTDQLRIWVRESCAAHRGLVDELLGGRDALLRFFIGEVMKRSGGRADPHRLRELLDEELRRYAEDARREGDR